jgi:tripartite-type tricarboxylate transporter receptor subunit TctC
LSIGVAEKALRKLVDFLHNTGIVRKSIREVEANMTVGDSVRRTLLLPVLALAGLACAFGCGRAGAQGTAAYPVRTVQIVVPFTPGTGADILARTLGPKLSERWKVGVITDNRPGATGNIGAEFVAKAAPDGHTLLFAATSFGTTPPLYPKLPFDPARSFAPVILIATSGLALVVHPQLPVKSVKEFIQLAKRRPGQMHYSSPGNGGPQHLAMELFKLETGIDIVHVPYKGLSGAITDLMGGHVQAMISATQTAASAVHSGRLRVLGVMSPERSAAFPEAPTLKEQGLANLEVETWYGAFAPAGTPVPVVGKINSDINALLQLLEMREVLANQGMTARGGTPERFGDMVRKELARWDRVVKAAKITAD